MYLHLRIENFRLFAALRVSTCQAAGPIVLADEAGRVAELNQVAQARDLSPGMTMARALSCCSEITVLHADAAAERAAKRLLWKLAWQLTPQIEMGEGAMDGSATLELLRPDIEALAARVPKLLERLRRFGLPARAGLATTPDWAGLAASAAERFQLKILPNKERVDELLAHLPLAVLDCLSADACRILEGWGIRSLAAVAALPRQDLGERLGPAGLRAWDKLNGAAPCMLRFRELESDYGESFDLEEPVQDLPSLRWLVQQAVETLERQLEQSGKMARALSLDLWMENKTSLRKTIRLPEATRRADLLERLLGNYLEQQSLASPVVRGRVAVDPVDPFVRQAGLFERSVRNPWRLQETLDQLAGLLGSEAFGTPRMRDSHRPDDYQLMPLPENEPNAGEPSRESDLAGPPRMGPPMRRFRPPFKSTVWFEQNRLAHVDSSLVAGPVTAAHGPYCWDGDWASAKPWRFCEWDVQVEASGVFRLRRSGENWQLIGAYD